MAAGLIVLAAILGSVATALIIPFLIAVYLEESQAVLIFGSTAAAYAFFASAIFISLRGKERGLKRIETFGLLLLAWILLLFSGALPLGLSLGMPTSQALFETVSAITTNNASTFPEIVALPKSVLFWRVQLQWLGGFLTLLSMVIVLAPTGVGGLPKRQIALLERVGFGGGGRILKTCVQIGTTYVGLTFTCAVLLFLSGMPLFESFSLASGALSTGGFMPVDGGVSSLNTPAAYPILMVFMIIGATSILWHRMIIIRRGQLLREHRESYFIIGAVLLLGLLLSIGFSQSANLSASGQGITNEILSGFFLAASLISTTGYEWVDGDIGKIPPIVVGCIILIGGGAFSTAGGLKFYRLGGMLTQSFQELNRLVFPHSIQSERFGGSLAEISVLKAIWSLLIVAVLIVWVCASVLSLDGIPFEAALIASLSAFSAVGSAYDPNWNNLGLWPEFSEMALLSKSALGVTMLLGRIEVLVFFGLFNMTYWNTR